MRTFLGLFLMTVVSGDEEVTVKGFLGDCVLLPCPCPKRDLDLKWQKDAPTACPMFSYKGNTAEFKGSYKGRVQIFLEKDNNNCSVLLINITQGDQGKYRCIFHSQGLYTRSLVTLNITARQNVPDKKTVGDDMSSPERLQNHSTSIRPTGWLGTLSAVLWSPLMLGSLSWVTLPPCT